MNAENVLERVAAAATPDEIDKLTSPITRLLADLAERRLQLEARQRGAPKDEQLAAELDAVGAEQDRLKEALDVAMQRRAEMRSTAKKASEDALFGTIEKLTADYGRKWQTRQRLIRELRTVLAELDAAETEDRRLRQALLNAGLQLPTKGLGPMRVDVTPAEVPLGLKGEVRELDKLLFDLAAGRLLFDFKRKKGRAIGPRWATDEAEAA